MKINDFKLEVFFGKHEFTAPYLLSQSDCQSLSIQELLDLEPGAEELFLKEGLGYTQVAGNPKLREAIAKLYLSMTAENILVHTGAQEAIFNFMNVFLNKEDHVISQFPIYQSLYEIGSAIGCEHSKWDLSFGEEGWTIDIDALEGLIKANTKLIVLNTPNNPTGCCLSEKEIAQIVAIAKKHDLYIFSDEVYKGLEFDGIKAPWLADCYEKAVSLGVMSKAYGLPGLRIGWIATKDKEILEKLTKMKHYTSICSSGPSEFLATIALKHGQTILEKNTKLIKENLKMAADFFKDHSDLFDYKPHKAGPIAFIKLKGESPVDDFCQRLLDEKGVLLLPASIYEVEGQFFRMGFGRSNFPESFKVFTDYIKKLA